MSNVKKYIPYPFYNENKFFEKIYKKQEFYENKGKLDSFDVCRKKSQFFKLLNHQILIRNYLSLNTPYNSVLLFHAMGTGKTCSAITIAESYRKTLLGSSAARKVLVLRYGNVIEENFKQEIHTIGKGYEQCTFAEYVNYNKWDTDIVKKAKLQALISKNYEFEGYQSLVNKMQKMFNTYKGKPNSKKLFHKCCPIAGTGQ